MCEEVESPTVCSSRGGRRGVVRGRSGCQGVKDPVSGLVWEPQKEKNGGVRQWSRKSKRVVSRGRP